MPNPMKKPMPGGGMVSPMRMEMGHGGDMERAVKIYLMKKGGKTAFPDLTGDGKVTFADILRGRLKKGKKKSMNNGGAVGRPAVGGLVNDLLYDLTSQDKLQAPEPMRRRGPRLNKRALDPMSAEERDAFVRFGRGRALDSAIQVPFMQYKDGNPDLYYFMGDQDEAQMRQMGVEKGADIKDYADAMYRQGQSDPIIDESHPQAVTKVFNTGFGPSHAARFTYLDRDKGKELKVRSQAYGGKVKMMKGGKVEYGLGGAVMGGLNALMQGKGLAGAAGAAAKGFVTPGSGIAQGANLVGNLAQRSNNPMLQNVGKVAGMASNFLPGGNPMGALGNLAGMFQARGGMMVPPKMRLLRR